MTRLRSLISLAAVFLLNAVADAAPRPVRLFEILAVRFAIDPAGAQTMDAGLLNALGEFRIFDHQPVASGIVVPPEALDRLLITGPSWFAYDVLGAEALSNFQIGNPLIFVGEQSYFPVAVADAPRLDVGEVVNISTRATVTPGADPVIGGFIVVGSPRRILIRAVGPGLSDFGVTAPLADPSFTLFRTGSAEAVTSNDDWGQRADADAIAEAAIATGAFALSRTSRDAACLIALPPGTYTVHLSTTGTTGGTALLEVYSVP